MQSHHPGTRRADAPCSGIGPDVQAVNILHRRSQHTHLILDHATTAVAHSAEYFERIDAELVLKYVDADSAVTVSLDDDTGPWYT